jgi:hypothetical protein
METPYNELPLDERDSDRKEADKVLALIREAGWKSPEDWKEKWDASEHYK